jgi:hypothetical protein
MELDKLLVKIEADLSDLKRGLDKANREVSKSSSKMSNEFKRFGTTLANVGDRVIKFGGLLAGAFGAFQIKQVVDVGRQIEDLQVRLKALFGTAEEGARAFDEMVKFASKVPFTLAEIQGASGNLAVVADDAKELAELLEITGNVAGATGLSFQQTAEQIQRSFSGGIASADVFRERGVRSMLGFQVGAEVSINETVKRFKEVFGRGGEFGNVTDDLANTLTGTLSMLSDKLFQFRKAIADEFMVEIKKQFSDLNQSLEDAEEKIVEFGRAIGENLASAVKLFVENIDGIIFGLKALAVFLGSAVGLALVRFIKNLNKVVLALATLGVFYDDIKNELDKFIGGHKEGAKEAIGLGDALDIVNKSADNYRKQWDRISDPTRVAVFAEQESMLDKLGKQFEKLQGESARFNKVFEDAVVSIGDAFGEAVASGKDFGDSMKKIFQNVIAQVVSLIVQILVLKPLLDSIKASLEGQTIGSILGGFTKDITSLIGLQNGGYTAPNKPYLVGERGAEVFVPRTAGNIIPNNQIGGGVTVNQNISFSTGIVPTVRAEVLNLLPTIKQETINAVAETRSRGGAFARTFGA